MTTIVALRRPNGSVDMGADSQSTGDVVSRVQKLARVNDQFCIGVAGRTRFGNVLRYIEVPRVHDSEYGSPGFDAEKYLITQVVPAWVEGLNTQFKRIPDQRSDWPDGVALVVVAGRIFTVHHDFTVTESAHEFDGIGSGSGYALGALAAGKSVEKAMDIAVDLDVWSGGDVVVWRNV